MQNLHKINFISHLTVSISSTTDKTKKLDAGWYLESKVFILCVWEKWVSPSQTETQREK